MTNIPVIIVNFKAYENCIGDSAIRLAQICERVTKTTNISIAVAVQPSDIYHITMAARLPVFAQHIDPVGTGAHTGSILAEAVKQSGATGTLLNHSERMLSFAELKQALARAKTAGLVTIVCAATPEEAKKIALLKPDAIAIEPPELIGGNVSVSAAQPEIITATTDSIKDIPILCGAGIKTAEDVRKAVQLGVKGILVASGVTLAQHPEAVLQDFARAFQKI